MAKQRPIDPPPVKRTTAVIVCPGPSAVELTDLPKADFTLGVNRAVVAHTFDFWCFNDGEIFLKTRPLGTPRVFTTKLGQQHVKIHGGGDRLARHDVTLVEDIWGKFPENGWTIYTATGALALAAHLGAQEVDVYGADWKPGAPDFDGVQTSTNRGQDRWDTEGQIWESMTKHLLGLGITVRRIVHES
jgi:hypothetical protein